MRDTRRFAGGFRGHLKCFSVSNSIGRRSTPFWPRWSRQRASCWSTACTRPQSARLRGRLAGGCSRPVPDRLRTDASRPQPRTAAL